MGRNLRAAVAGVFLTSLFGWYALNGALEGRGRDAVEGGVPALLLSAFTALAIRRMLRHRRS